MRRDILKKAEQGKEYIYKKHERADMTRSELLTLFKLYKEASEGNELFDAVTAAFYAGVAVGAGLEGHRFK